MRTQEELLVMRTQVELLEYENTRGVTGICEHKRSYWYMRTQEQLLECENTRRPTGI